MDRKEKRKFVRRIRKGTMIGLLFSIPVSGLSAALNTNTPLEALLFYIISLQTYVVIVLALWIGNVFKEG